MEEKTNSLSARLKRTSEREYLDVENARNFEFERLMLMKTNYIKVIL